MAAEAKTRISPPKSHLFAYFQVQSLVNSLGDTSLALNELNGPFFGLQSLTCTVVLRAFGAVLRVQNWNGWGNNIFVAKICNVPRLFLVFVDVSNGFALFSLAKKAICQRRAVLGETSAATVGLLLFEALLHWREALRQFAAGALSTEHDAAKPAWDCALHPMVDNVATDYGCSGGGEQESAGGLCRVGLLLQAQRGSNLFVLYVAFIDRSH